jgi:hypothetical protein
MILYHGSYVAVAKPDIAFSRDNVDFGKGFYTTPIQEQAVRWSERFKRRRGHSVLSLYELDEIGVRRVASILEFGTYSKEWLDFIFASRCGESIGNWDIVIGGVANDKVFDTIEAFLNGFYNKEQAIEKLKYSEPNIQYCFKNQRIIDEHLKFISSEEL